MKIKILTPASLDLIDGYNFYEKQAENVGSYFLDSLYSDINSLVIFAGIAIAQNNLSLHQMKENNEQN